MELGLDVRIADSWRVGLQVSPEIGVAPAFGLGMATRLGLQVDL